MIDAAQLVAATGCSDEAAQNIARPLSDSCLLWGINTPARIARYVAHTAYETERYTAFVESLRYTRAQRLVDMWPHRFRLPTPDELGTDRFADGKRNAFRYTEQPERLAEFVYGGRLGNGPEGSGDGWAFIGRGAIMTTGRRNYELVGESLGYNFLGHPEFLAEPQFAFYAAGFFWQSNGLNELADAGNDIAITRRITGAMTGWDVPDNIHLSDRKELTAAGLVAFA